MKISLKNIKYYEKSYSNNNYYETFDIIIYISICEIIEIYIYL